VKRSWGRIASATAALTTFGLALVAQHAVAQSTAPQAPAPITVPSFSLPYSSFNSPEAVALLEQMRKTGPIPPNSSIAFARAFYDKQNSDRVRRMRAIYQVKVVEDTIGGVHVQRVTPTAGIAPENRSRVLINLHGGAFMWGADSGALAEAVPIAAVGRIEVVTVDYRMAPEFRFPAASEDVAAVYKALLAKYSPKAIGIYGCSAGGVLTAESVAWIVSKKMPVPGAIGTFCGSLVEFGGDSAYFGPASTGQKPDANALQLSSIPYFAGARVDDPLVLPGVSKSLLTRFPPTLLITGSRDFAMSSVLHSNELLQDAGVRTELHVWDGMPHAFFVDPEPRESQQAYRAIAQFFQRYLAAR
jgi:monoterpene epsilon-lactone hydrolase